jgi:hypothetical protein
MSTTGSKYEWPGYFKRQARFYVFNPQVDHSGENKPQISNSFLFLFAMSNSFFRFLLQHNFIHIILTSSLSIEKLNE